MMLSKRTKYSPKHAAPPPAGPCGGIGIWYITPYRHWCKMTDAEIALFILGGGEMHEVWGTANFDKAWLEGTIALRHPETREWRSVVLNSKCRWKKK